MNDLITCVHGLHHVEDKLGALASAANWLTPGGLLIGRLDLAGIPVAGQAATRRLSRVPRDPGFSRDSRRHLRSPAGEGSKPPCPSGTRRG